jgi:hypothetical protein
MSKQKKKGKESGYVIMATFQSHFKDVLVYGRKYLKIVCFLQRSTLRNSTCHLTLDLTCSDIESKFHDQWGKLIFSLE